jgi:hypothetical protein
MKLPFAQVFAFRPGYLHPTPGLKNTLPLYKFIGWLYPILKKLYPKTGTLLSELGLAMINVTKFGYDKKILEVGDIETVADRQYV